MSYGRQGRLHSASSRPLAIRPEPSELTTARTSSTYHKPLMSCRSCRLKKIKCNKSRPACAACDLAQCACIYDAIPRKRGPNSELLKHMLKRIEDLESSIKSSQASRDSQQSEGEANSAVRHEFQSDIWDDSMHMDSSGSSLDQADSLNCMEQALMVDAFFQKFHGRPHFFLHEATVRQEIKDHRIALEVLYAIYSVGVQYTDRDVASRRSQCEQYAILARQQLDVDEPTLASIQTSILLTVAYFAIGQVKKCWMQLGIAIRMLQALGLHQEQSITLTTSSQERELGRRCFWTCYAMDRLSVSGSNRPCLIADDSVSLRLPCIDHTLSMGLQSHSPFFQESFGNRLSGMSIHLDCYTMLIDTLRILGKANRYIQHGGVKGDSHFPWHPMSVLSTIRNELEALRVSLDYNDSQTDSLEQVQDSMSLFLCKCIYHLIHVLILRPFLPFFLHELGADEGTRHQAWQVEATRMCIDHANNIVNLTSSTNDGDASNWPPYILYCLASAATVLIHGAHHTELYAVDCQENLERAMRFLQAMGSIWSCADSQYHVVRRVQTCHQRLIRRYESEQRYPGRGQLDGFFERYQGLNVDPSYLPFHNQDHWTTSRSNPTENAIPAPTDTPWPLQESTTSSLPLPFFAPSNPDLETPLTQRQPPSTVFLDTGTQASSSFAMDQPFDLQTRPEPRGLTAGGTHDQSVSDPTFSLFRAERHGSIDDADPMMELLRELARNEAAIPDYLD